MKKIIYFNGRFLTQYQTGVQRFAVELLNELNQFIEIHELPDYQFTCLVPPGNIESIHRWGNIQIKICGKLKGNLWEQLALPFYARNGLLIDLCNIGPICHFNQIIVIHDASVFAIPKSYSRIFRLKYKFVYFFLSRIAKKIITVSQFSKKEISRFLQIPQEKIMVISEGCDHILRIEKDDAILKKISYNQDPYFLAVGSNSIHKNLNIVVQAILQLKNNLPKLVIVGGDYTKVFRNVDQIKNEKILYLGYVTDEQLRSLYEHATAFIFPSLYEGFGLPPLEALACGCPAICSNRAAIPEICGDAVLYFNPQNIQEIKTQIDILLTNKSLQTQLRKKGKEYAMQFTWHKTAEMFIQTILSSNFNSFNN
ncbi:MAG: glycosyltransferase family 4 protein [Pelolinea sp.]|jgi:glycosyltransferase involved in cell wall biosynthesis|nr:glycosyltransferase family 4 protein [Pelolinea sp.]